MNRGEGVRSYTVFQSQSVMPGGYVETQPISLRNASGFLNLQPDIQEGTFDIDIYVCDFVKPIHWSSPISVATGLTNTDHDSISVDLQGVHLWMKIRATEKSGVGAPAFGDGLAICID